jgi:hypothetical protein
LPAAIRSSSWRFVELEAASRRPSRMRRVRCSRSARNSASFTRQQRAGVVDAVAQDVQFAGTGEPSSTAEISTDETTRTPSACLRRSPPRRR